MKVIATIAIGAFSLVAAAQTTTFPETPHIHTTLNHFTVIDPGEPISMFAIADHSSFAIERSGDKLFVEPLRENAATNLFIWTTTRQLIYEIDPAGDLSKMDMLVRIPPSAHTAQQSAVTASLSAENRRQLSMQEEDEALMRSENITLDDQKQHPGEIAVRIEEVLRSKDQLVIRFSLRNQSTDPFRVNTPDVFQPRPTEIPISLLSLRDHQLNQQTASRFKATKGSPIDVIQAKVLIPNLEPGQATTGIITISGSEQSAPTLYELDFGSFQNNALTAEVVL
ncbi:TrbG/VirB9 family P-type conjugative transfer protein [Acidicapsa dinghuensis]|uniref:TrbG/VirB9 family P-type conjugative transfer protein n=1 Tax=Acidicapsa dinghuensis TaxID=2218256 RepID=A0ABW1ECL8_9BACT|nr:TrbG/VirB9 family P-type conjugative transfer protein [Acidicapsa dinghuensis]